MILVVDNDTGGRQVLNLAASKSKREIRYDAAINHFHLFHNIYVVKTPLVGEAASTEIEDLFPADVLATEIDGKTFDRKKTYGDDTTYSKSDFAEKVVRPGVDQIDFSGFQQLLTAISASVLHYQSSKPTSVAVAEAS